MKRFKIVIMEQKGWDDKDASPESVQYVDTEEDRQLFINAYNRKFASLETIPDTQLVAKAAEDNFRIRIVHDTVKKGMRRGIVKVGKHDIITLPMEEVEDILILLHEQSKARAGIDLLDHDFHVIHE